MQIKIFTIPIGNPEQTEQEVNTFLRGHRVLDVVHEFVPEGASSRWCLLIKTLDSAPGQGNGTARKDRVDYKDILDESSFARFCTLRKARKSVADHEGVPAFALFTDKQMAEMARFAPLTLENMGQVEGIGPGKTEKFGQAILQALAEFERQANEAGR